MATTYDGESDYGSDFSLDDIRYEELLARLPVDIEDTVRDGPPRARDLAAAGDDKAPPSDDRPPLQRFRLRAKTPSLSVSDLTAPAWCELQYFYTLSHYGRKPATEQMKRGTAVHQRLEDEIFTTVRVEARSLEDRAGLQVWNMLQGLRALQRTGITRELKIWGSVKGVLVTGVVDELSTRRPASPDPGTGEETSLEQLFPTIDSYFQTRAADHAADARVYLCDVKTRSASGVPTATAFRPTRMQLMLYHRLLGEMAEGKFDLSLLARRERVDVDTPFTDAFTAEMGALESDLGTHNTIAKLWSCMLRLLQEILPDGRRSLGNILRVEYRTPRRGQVKGDKTFYMDAAALEAYIDHTMQWWVGERPAQGVPVEEASKCRYCEFAELCEWRASKIEEAYQRAFS